MNRVFIILISTILGCNYSPAQNQKLVLSLNDTTIKIRGNIIELSENNYRLDYYDVYEDDSLLRYLQSKNYQGGGPSWFGIIYGTILLSDPTLLNKIRLDDESDGIAIWSSDKETLLKIGRLISVVKSDEEILIESIQVAEKKGMME